MAKIDFSKICEAAQKVAEYAGQDFGNEAFLGCEIVTLTPVQREAATAFEPKQLFELTTAHWVLLNDHEYEDPGTLSRRIMRWTLTAKEIMNYEPEYTNGAILDPEGDFDIVEWDELVAVGSGKVPDDVVAALCSHLEEEQGEELAETYAEIFNRKQLPPWDPRILKVVEKVCLEFGDAST
jgi:hypothetical protein